MLRCMGCMNEIDAQQTVCPHCGYVRGTPPREAYHLAPETILQGRYIVGRVLGYGGFGVTYLGYDAALERAVAIKEFLPSTFATRIPGDTSVTVYEGNATTQFTAGLTRFVEEAQTLAQFNGVAGIVDIYDSFSGNDTAYIVMQCLHGQDVKAILTATGALPYETAREIILAVCDTLTAVHAKGIIHRDISPDNIYITTDNEIKLLDFGAARYESAVNSKSLSVILKSGYAPEEQYRSRGEQGFWTDVYALAATFYKMITGVTPPDSMERSINDALKEPSKLGAQLPQSAENAILNALCVRKNQRTQTAAEFKAALLADGVERIKVKKTRAGVARVPIAARIAIGASVCLLLGLGIFGASGGFDKSPVVEQGTLLTDTYGSGLTEGFVTVPSLAGKTQEEAATLLETAGLVPEIGGRIFSGGALDTPLVSDQLPLSGRQLKAGSPVRMTLNLGDYDNAVALGHTKALTDTPLLEALSFVGDGISYGDGVVLDFAYSDAAQTNTIRAVEPMQYDSGEQYQRLLVGVGADDAQAPFGALRTAFLEGSAVRFCIASAQPAMHLAQEAQATEHDTVLHRLTLSPVEGENSFVVEGATETKGYLSAENGVPYNDRIFIPAFELAQNAPGLLDRPLHLRLERFYEDGTPLDALELTQTYTVSLDTQGSNVQTIAYLSQAEAEALFADGAFTSDPMAELYLFSNDWAGKYACVRLTGDFPQTDGYKLVWGDSEQWLQRKSSSELLGFLPLKPPQGATADSAVYLMNAWENPRTDASANTTVWLQAPVVLPPVTPPQND